jgi:hypothetical protein
MSLWSVKEKLLVQVKGWVILKRSVRKWAVRISAENYFTVIYITLMTALTL